MKKIRWSLLSLLIASWCFLSSPLQAAEVIELEVAPNIIATADYHQGDTQMPAILLMHGFLQTQNFFTVKRLFDSLASSGYTLLSPNLSLGLNRRAKSLPCESIHTNSIDDDIAEINQWATWLTEKSGQQLIMIGHSMGATELVAYLERYKGNPVKQAIFISIVPIGPGWPDNNANLLDRKRAENGVATDHQGISEYAIAYCKNIRPLPTTCSHFTNGTMPN